MVRTVRAVRRRQRRRQRRRRRRRRRRGRGRHHLQRRFLPATDSLRRYTRTLYVAFPRQVNAGFFFGNGNGKEMATAMATLPAAAPAAAAGSSGWGLW